MAPYVAATAAVFLAASAVVQASDCSSASECPSKEGAVLLQQKFQHTAKWVDSNHSVESSLAMFLQGTSNARDQFKKQLEYELTPAAQSPSKSKVALSIIWFFNLGLCGIDRCYMDQWLLGTLKCLTGGGFMIWFFIDWLVIIINMLQKAPTIDTMAFRATFPKDELDTAFYIAIIGLALQALTTLRGGSGMNAAFK